MPSEHVTGFYTLDERLQRIKGWVVDTTAPASSQWVEILADDTVVGVAHASLERGDLARLGTGHTCYGFDYLFPALTGAPRGAIDIAVRHRESGTRLPTHSTSFRMRPVSETTVPVRDIDHLREREIFRSETRVPIDSNRWHGDPAFREQLTGFNGKTARRVGKMRAGESGSREYTKAVRYYRIHDAEVIMPFGLLIADGYLIRGNLGFPHPAQVRPVLSNPEEGEGDDAGDWLKTAAAVNLRVVDGTVHRVDHPALLMSAPRYQGYNHWHVDVLPMLTGVERLPEGSVNQIIGPESPTHWHRESLQLALSLYPGLEFSEYGALGILRVPELIYTTGLAGNGCYLSPALVEFYGRISALVDDAGGITGAGRRLYLSRRAYPRRALLNEAEIERTAASLGFQVIDPAAYSYKDQIRLFRQAEFIVSPHGAALTNLLFCRQGVTVIELFADCYFNLGLQRLANLKQARYGYLVGRAGVDQADAGGHDFTYTIDAAALARLIEEMSD